MAEETLKRDLDGTVTENRHYETLEKEFQEVLQELVADKSLDRFRIEYEKVFRALRKTHDNEIRLVKKCRELNAEVVSNAAKVQTAVRLSEEEQVTINKLKEELERAWKAVDSSRSKEEKAQASITSLKAEVAHLNKLLEQGGNMGMAEDHTMAELMAQKEELARERDAQVEQIVSLRNDMIEIAERLRQVEADRAAVEAEAATLREQVLARKADADRESKKRERLEKEARDLRLVLESRQSDISAKQLQVQAGEESLQRLEAMLRDQRGANDRLTKEFNSQHEKFQKLQKDLEEQVSTNSRLLTENSLKQVELKTKQDEIEKLQAEVARVLKAKEVVAKKIKALEDEREAVESERSTVKGNIAVLEKELESTKRELELERKRIEELHRERDMLSKMKTQADNATTRQSDLVKVNESARRNLEQEVAGYRLEAQRQAKLIAQLEKEREKYGLEANEAGNRFVEALDKVKVKELEVVELQKKIAEGETRLKQQQALYEAVRADRNLYSKNLIEAQDEIAEMRRKFKTMQHQIEQLKEEIGAKDQALVKEHFDHQKAEKEKDTLRLELNKAKMALEEEHQASVSQRAEIDKLGAIIAEADAERLRQRKEYETVLSERDILGTQLIRRNDELALVYEKIKLQQSTISKGQLAYRDRLNEIRVLRIKLADLKRNLHVLRSSCANVELLKRELHHLGRELLHERSRVKALADELENPLNVHRWRKLEGSDPSAYEMIQKIQTLQKRLIAKTEEVVEKDLLVAEKEKLYVELKAILARQPGPEVTQQLSLYQAHLREKTKQMKSMASELNMYQAQVAEHKYEIERLLKELGEVKKKYFEHKRREQQQQQQQREAMGAAAKPLGTRVVGGGYNLATPTSVQQATAAAGAAS